MIHAQTRTLTHSSARLGCLAVLVGSTVLLTAVPVAPAATYYVTPAGAGLADGSNWANAFSNVQDAVNAVAGVGDAIYLKEGDYLLGSALSISGKPDFHLSGGYEGSGTPGGLGTAASVLKADAAGMRVVNAANATFTFERVTIAGGNLYADGAGLYLDNCQSTLSSVVVRDNVAARGSYRGAGIFAQGGSLTIRDSQIRENALESQIYGSGQDHTLRGAGVYAGTVTLSVSNSLVHANRVYGGHSRENYSAYGYGGGLFLDGGSAEIHDSVITDNTVLVSRVRHSQSYGGGLYANNTTPLHIVSSDFSGNGCRSDCSWPDGGSSSAPVQHGGALYLTGAGLDAQILDSTFTRNVGIPGEGGSGELRIAGGAVTMTNCLVALNAQGGVVVGGGVVTIANSTIADNTGWGLQRTGGSITLIDSIVWGNLGGGVDGTVSATYSCTQELLAGAGNFNDDPLFVGDYYLSVAGLTGQSMDSPCLNAGSDSAANLGLDRLTTRTDGVNDSGAVNLGYHYAAAFDGDLLNLALYVDAEEGDDANNGRAPGSGNAFKTIGKALSVAVRDSVIQIAAGSYDADLGESFPLEVTVPHLHLAGSGAGVSRIDADGASSRVLRAVASGRLRISGLTLQNGRMDIAGLTTDLSALRGAGLYLLNGDVTLSNCILSGHTLNATVHMNPRGYYLGGAGIFSAGGSLTLTDTVVRENSITRSGGQWGFFAGAGLDAQDVAVTVSGSSFVSNRLDSSLTTNYDYYLQGAAINMRNGSAIITDASFVDNICIMPHARFRYAFGGAICAERSVPVMISESRFEGNWVGPLKAATESVSYYLRGGTLYFFNGAEGVLDRCYVIDGATPLYSDTHGGIEIAYVGSPSTAPASATLWITNSLIAANARDGVAVRGAKARLELVNSTVGDNTEWGLRNYSAGALQTVHNSIVWGNTLGGISTNAGDTVNYTLSQEMHPGTQNKSADPLFAAPGTGNYRLLDGSPAWNAGLDADWMVGAVDLDGNPRLQGTVDLGCYELPPPGGTLFMVR